MNKQYLLPAYSEQLNRWLRDLALCQLGHQFSIAVSSSSSLWQVCETAQKQLRHGLCPNQSAFLPAQFVGPVVLCSRSVRSQMFSDIKHRVDRRLQRRYVVTLLRAQTCYATSVQVQAEPFQSFYTLRHQKLC